MAACYTACSSLVGSGTASPRFFIVVGGGGALDEPELHHPASPRELGGHSLPKSCHMLK